MNFCEQLQAQRKASGLSVKDASDRLGMSVTGYQDRETGRTEINVPERLGLLVGLGMPVEPALAISSKPEIQCVSDLMVQFEQDQSEPFVKETEDAFVLADRDHECDYEILKTRVTSPMDILNWVAHLTEKNWVTGEHLNIFINLASEHLNLQLH